MEKNSYLASLNSRYYAAYYSHLGTCQYPFSRYTQSWQWVPMQRLKNPSKTIILYEYGHLHEFGIPYYDYRQSPYGRRINAAYLK